MENLYILCVDDEKIVLDSLNTQLSRNFGSDYNYEFAESAEEALEIIEDLSDGEGSPIFVIISDWLMPGMKGDELIEEAQKKINNVKTILLTGYVDHEVIQRIEQKAKKPFQIMYKPWKEEKLIQLINSNK